MNAIPIFEARNLRKHFTLSGGGNPVSAWLSREAPVKLHAVDDVSFAIFPGEAVGLVGESGCGKSTLARVVSRLTNPTSGAIRIAGKEVTGSAQSFVHSDLRRQIQMVFQDPTESLNPRFNAFDIIADSVRQLCKLDRAGIAMRVEQAAKAVNLPLELLSRFPHQLSGGQKARVGIARAMAVEPSLLVLDEPTSALDVSVQATVLKLLARLRLESGVALLFVSHDLNVVRLLCDRIIVMYLGEIVESGTTEQVFDSPRHPYTRALLSAIPTLRGDRSARIRLDGDPRSPVDPDPNACRLQGRCPRQQELCARRAPLLTENADHHAFRCHFPIEKGQR